MEDEQATFSEMEENYKAAIDEAKKIIKGEFGADEEDRDLQPERAVQLAAQRRSLQEQDLEILNYVKEELEKAEVTMLHGSLKVQREALLKAVRRLQEAKELTKELLAHETNDHQGLEQDEHRKWVEFDKRQMEMMTLIAGFKNSLAPQQG